METTAEIVHFQKKQEAKFICSACGADRGCNCNAPAVEKLAAFKEKARQRSNRSYDKKRQQKQQTSDVRKRSPALASDPIQEDCVDCTTAQEQWQHSISNLAGDAISMCAFWTRQFGEWEKFETPSSLVTLAKQAAEAWKKLASDLSKRSKRQ